MSPVKSPWPHKSSLIWVNFITVVRRISRKARVKNAGSLLPFNPTLQGCEWIEHKENSPILVSYVATLSRKRISLNLHPHIKNGSAAQRWQLKNNAGPLGEEERHLYLSSFSAGSLKQKGWFQAWKQASVERPLSLSVPGTVPKTTPGFDTSLGLRPQRIVVLVVLLTREAH